MTISCLETLKALRDGFMLTLILNKDDYKFNKHKVWYCALMSLECEIWYLRLNDTNVNRLVASTSWVDANLLMILFPFIYQELGLDKMSIMQC
jgi:hypothetical protein